MKNNNQTKLERTNPAKVNKNEERVGMACVNMRYRMKKMSNNVRRNHSMF